MHLLRAPTFWGIIGVFIGGYLLMRWVDSIGGPEGVQERFGAAAPFVTGSLQLSLSLTPFPSDVVCIAHGMLYGFWVAAALNWFVWWLAALLEYALGRRARIDFDLERRWNRLPHRLRRFPVEHPAFLILARQVPWAGAHLTTLLPGARGVSFGRIGWCSAIAIIPGALVMAALGAGLLQLQRLV